MQDTQQKIADATVGKFYSAQMPLKLTSTLLLK
jgi:hypothetical protein